MLTMAVVCGSDMSLSRSSPRCASMSSSRLSLGRVGRRGVGFIEQPRLEAFEIRQHIRGIGHVYILHVEIEQGDLSAAE